MASEKILQSVVEITRQRDQDSLAVCLLSALAECVANSTALFYQVDTAAEADNFSCSVLSIANEEITIHEIDVQEVIPEPVKRCKQEARVLDIEEVGSHLYFHPVIGNEKVVAVLELQSDSISDSDKKVINAICRVYENFLEVINESTRDTLTGLLNRRTFETRINNLIANYHDDLEEEENKTGHHRRVKDESLPHWLAVIDIDFFKRINDNFGHIYGDEVLLLLSQIMKNFFRKSDLIYRFGGEEFVVVIRPANENDAVKVFDRFRQRVEEFDFPQVGKVTISTGLAMINKNDYPSSVLDVADKALYYAKENGRNQVCCYEQLVSEGKIEESKDSGDVELF